MKFSFTSMEKKVNFENVDFKNMISEVSLEQKEMMVRGPMAKRSNTLQL